MPKASKETASQVEDMGVMVGHYEDLDGYTVGFETFREDADATPLMKGLPDDRCQSQHWGYVVNGSVTFKYAEHEETYETGDACLIFPAYGKTWPSAEVTIGSVRVDFTAGYGTDPTLVPASARHAIKLAVAHLYEQREGAAKLPDTIRQVLGPASWGYIP